MENEQLQKKIYTLLCEHNMLCENAVTETPFEELPESIRCSLRQVVNLATALTGASLTPRILTGVPPQLATFDSVIVFESKSHGNRDAA